MTQSTHARTPGLERVAVALSLVLSTATLSSFVVLAQLQPGHSMLEALTGFSLAAPVLAMLSASTAVWVGRKFRPRAWVVARCALAASLALLVWPVLIVWGFSRCPQGVC
jgi:hypothetical protein